MARVRAHPRKGTAGVRQHERWTGATTVYFTLYAKDGDEAIKEMNRRLAALRAKGELNDFEFVEEDAWRGEVEDAPEE